ncbi:MAG: hypothetical protein U0Z75_05640 [Deinococcaceae bacterium]
MPNKNVFSLCLTLSALTPTSAGQVPPMPQTATVLVRDVVNWQDDAAMDQSSFKWFDAQGRLIRTIRHPRIKLTQGAAVDSHCLWITGVAYNPYARPKSTQETETISCIDLKSTAVKDYFIPGFQGVHPSVSPTTGKVFVGCATGPKVAVIQNGKATVINLKQYFHQIDSGLKSTHGFIHMSSHYYIQTVDMKNGGIGLVQIDEKTEKPIAIQSINGYSVRSIHNTDQLYEIVQSIKNPSDAWIGILDSRIKPIRKIKIPNSIDPRSIIFLNKEKIVFLKDERYFIEVSLNGFKFKRIIFEKQNAEYYKTFIKEDKLYVGSQVGGQDLTILDLKTGSKKTIKAAQSMDGLESL